MFRSLHLALLIFTILISVCHSSSSGYGSGSSSGSYPDPSPQPNGEPDELTPSEQEEVEIIYLFSKDAIVNDRKELCSLCLSNLSEGLQIGEEDTLSGSTEASPFPNQPRIYTLLSEHLVSVDVWENFFR